jgi:hypothetical protein
MFERKSDIWKFLKGDHNLDDPFPRTIAAVYCPQLGKGVSGPITEDLVLTARDIVNECERSGVSCESCELSSLAKMKPRN